MGNSENNKMKEKIRKVTSTLLLILLLGSLGVSLYYNIDLQEQIDRRDSIIEQLTQRDSILNEIIEIKYDSVSETISYSYRIKNGKVLKYDELSDELDGANIRFEKSVNDQITLAKENIQTVENYNKLVHDYIDLQERYNILISKYNKNIVVNKSSINSRNKLIDSLSNYKTIVDLVQSHYFIDYKITTEGKNRRIRIEAEKLDSALILLPYFRDRIKREKNKWIISIRK